MHIGDLDGRRVPRGPTTTSVPTSATASPSATRHKVEDHLDDCRQCTAIYLELTEVNSNLAGILAPIMLGARRHRLPRLGRAPPPSRPASWSPPPGRVRDGVTANVPLSAAIGVAAVSTVVGVSVAVSHEPGRRRQRRRRPARPSPPRARRARPTRPRPTERRRPHPPYPCGRRRPDPSDVPATIPTDAPAIRRPPTRPGCPPTPPRTPPPTAGPTPVPPTTPARVRRPQRRHGRPRHRRPGHGRSRHRRAPAGAPAGVRRRRAAGGQRRPPSSSPQLVQDEDGDDLRFVRAALADPARNPDHRVACPSRREAPRRPPAPSRPWSTCPSAAGVAATWSTTASPTASTRSTAASASRPSTTPRTSRENVDTPYGEPATVDLLENDTDPDGDRAHARHPSRPTHGTIDPAAGLARLFAAADDEGVVTYTPDAGWSGPDTVTYVVDDGHHQERRRCGSPPGTLRRPTARRGPSTTTRSRAPASRSPSTCSPTTPTPTATRSPSSPPSGAARSHRSVEIVDGKLTYTPDRRLGRHRHRSPTSSPTAPTPRPAPCASPRTPRRRPTAHPSRRGRPRSTGSRPPVTRRRARQRHRPRRRPAQPRLGGRRRARHRSRRGRPGRLPPAQDWSAPTP